MSINNSFSHLTLYERRIILTGITSDSSKTAIAQTIGKEIKLHRSLSYKCNMPLECINYRKCVYGRECTTNCPECIPFKCSRRDSSPGKFQKKESNVYKKRADRKYLRGRTYKDYKAYMDKNPDAFVIQKIEKDKVILKPYLLKNNISQMAVSINITHLRNGI